MQFKQLALGLLGLSLGLSASAELPSIVPLPSSMQEGEGVFVFNRPLSVNVAEYPGDSIGKVFNQFVPEFQKTATAGITPVKGDADIVLALDPTLGAEAYTLSVTPQAITIKAARPAGFFYALQTLSQMLAVAEGPMLDAVEIADEPLFGWRGFMLDEGRHIFGKDEVKKVIDLMAFYKMNRFHWHLTEDQGWRIEIKKYPKLTEVGAWRDSNKLAWREAGTDSITYGGFYTQDDIREIVNYAKDRFIEIVPEIDIPGHTQAAVAAYPEILACDPENPHEVWLHQGVSTDVMNVANPAAVQMAKDIIDELAELFPFPYLHLGGDECPTDKWQTNADCQALLAKIGSENYRDLQLNFYKELSDHIKTQPADHQRNLIFWNEVLHGNTDLIGNDIIIMAWVGADKAAKEAATRGMNTILSPQIPYYINRKQSTLPTEPMSQGRGTETVEVVYAYEPFKDVPEDLQSKYMGVQANFWSEWVDDPSVLQYLMMPRLAAVAEAGWTPQERRDYADFRNRIIAQFPYLDSIGWNYAKHILEDTTAAE